MQTCRWTSAKSRGCTVAGLPSLEYTHQPWSSPREEGLRSKWDEPRDPAASLADQTLRRRAAQTVHHRSPRWGPPWRGSQALEEKSSRASLATGPRPRRKLSDGLKRPDTPTSPRLGPSSFTSLAQATTITLRTATWRDTMRRKCVRDASTLDPVPSHQEHSCEEYQSLPAPPYPEPL